MNEQDRREIDALIRRAVKDGQKDGLRMLGFNLNEPQEIQADLQYLRNIRNGTRELRRHVIKSTIWAFICFFGYLVWESIKVKLKGE